MGGRISIAFTAIYSHLQVRVEGGHSYFLDCTQTLLH